MSRNIVFVAWLSVLVCAPVAMANVIIDPDPTGLIQNETSLVLNPASPGNVVVTYNDNPIAGSGFGLGVSVSTDGGANWAAGQLTAPSSIVGPSGLVMSRVFDPISAADRSGNLFAGYVADNSYGGDSGLYVELSTNQGTTWTPVAPVSTDPPATGPAGQDPNYRFNDKPHMEAGPSQANPNTDHLYVAWIKDRGYWPSPPASDIYFAWSANQGTSWNYPAVARINDVGTYDLGNGPNLAIASDGTIYCGWLDVNVQNPQAAPSTLLVDRSTDGGATWGGDVPVQNILSCPGFLTTGTGPDARARSYPCIAVSPTNPQLVYMVYAADPDGPGVGDEGDIYFVKSTDGGASWSTTPVRVNHDDPTQNDNFEPWMSVKPDGRIDVVWYDRRNDPGDALWDVYMATSTDAGATFSPNFRVTQKSFATPPCPAVSGAWMGEYLGIDTDGTYAYIAYTSGRSDPTNGDAWFAKVDNADLGDREVIPEPTALVLIGLLSLVRRGRRTERAC
jgi:hypothetical protein